MIGYILRNTRRFPYWGVSDVDWFLVCPLLLTTLASRSVPACSSAGMTTCPEDVGGQIQALLTAQRALRDDPGSAQRSFNFVDSGPSWRMTAMVIAGLVLVSTPESAYGQADLGTVKVGERMTSPV